MKRILSCMHHFRSQSGYQLVIVALLLLLSLLIIWIYLYLFDALADEEDVDAAEAELSDGREDIHRNPAKNGFNQWSQDGAGVMHYYYLMGLAYLRHLGSPIRIPFSTVRA